MPRYRLPFSITTRPDSPYFYFKLGTWKSYKSTGVTSEVEARRIAEAAYIQSISKPAGPTFAKYADKFFIWETCPHVARLFSEGKCIGHDHVKNNRSLLVHHVFPDPISNMMMSELKRADIIDFRTRLVAKLGYRRTTQRVISAVKVILKEAYFREELDRDLAAGVGNTKYEPGEKGTFTEDELRMLFPPQIPGPWESLEAYAVFMVAACTGMRRGEILALNWNQFNYRQMCIIVERAWKNKSVVGKPKWNKIRVTPLPDSLITPLMLVRGLQLEVYAGDLVFSYPDKSRLGGTWWQKNFRKGLDNAGIDYEKRHITAHSFRHTLNSLLREKGYDAAKIRASLGWSSVDVQDGYTHWSDAAFVGHRDIVGKVFT